MAKKKIPSIKKDIETFLNSEEGKISKKSALDLGIGIIALSLLAAGPASAAHSSYFQNVVGKGQHISSHTSCHTSCHSSCHSNCHSSHSNCHSSHSNCHSNHSNCHSNHSSCHFSCSCTCAT
jgi:hypothetical protein